MNASSSTPSHAGSGAFPTTHWSVVLNVGATDTTSARLALETLCRAYWYPLYGFVRRQGRSHHEAEDCTQAFLARLLATDAVIRARPERGRFRTFLLTALRHFLINDWQRAHAEKRGGALPVLSLDFTTADERFAQEPVDPALTPEQAFDRSWALGLLHAAIATLREDYERSGRGPQFAALVPFIWGNGLPESLAEPAARVGLNAHAFTQALHRLRRRLGERLRAAVAETVEDPRDVDAELRHLIAAVHENR